MIEIGRLCVKIAGRDAGRECLIIDKLSDNFVMIDGNTRRRKCNIKHLELLPQTAKIKKGASHEEVAKALSELGFKVVERKPKVKKEKADSGEKKEAVKEEKKTGILSGLIKKKEKPAEKPKAKKKAPAKKAKKKPVKKPKAKPKKTKEAKKK